MENRTLLPLAILLFIISTWFVLHYAKRRTSLFILLLSIVSFGMGSASVALLPIDLSYASSANLLSNFTHTSGGAGEADANGGDGDVDLGESNPTYLPWQATYWTTFFLAWLFLPITRASLLSGHFTLRRRIEDGLSRSFRTIALMAGCGVAFVVAMAIHLKSVHLVTIVLPVLMALSNTYGLVLVSLLLGNGLVNIPKRLWRQACPANELRRARIMAPVFEDELFEGVMGLEDVEEKVEEVCRTAATLREGGEGGAFQDEEGDATVGGAGGAGGGRARRCRGWFRKRDEATEFQECLEELVRRKDKTAGLCAGRRTRGGVGARRPGGRAGGRGDDDDGDGDDEVEINTMDMKYLVSLSRQLKRAQERVTTAALRWNHLMEHSRLFAALMDDALDGVSGDGGGGVDANLLLSAPPLSCRQKVRRFLQRLWIRCLRYPTYRFLALVTATLSASVLLGEVALSTPLVLSPFSWTLRALDHYRGKNDATGAAFQACALVPLLYMSLCVYACLLQMSLLGPYCLRGNRQSAGVALVFNAQYLVRLQFPLGYNYLLMLKYDMTHCAFSNIMSDMSTIPFFGTSFSVYAPLLILAVCLFTICDFYPKLLRLLGIEHEDALLLGDEDELDGKANEGIQLMKRDAERRGGAAGGGRSPSQSPEKQSLNGRRSIIV